MKNQSFKYFQLFENIQPYSHGASIFWVELHPCLYDTLERCIDELSIDGINAVWPSFNGFRFELHTSALYDAEEVWLRLAYKLEERAAEVDELANLEDTYGSAMDGIL